MGRTYDETRLYTTEELNKILNSPPTITQKQLKKVIEEIANSNDSNLVGSLFEPVLEDVECCDVCDAEQELTSLLSSDIALQIDEELVRELLNKPEIFDTMKVELPSYNYNANTFSPVFSEEKVREIVREEIEKLGLNGKNTNKAHSTAPIQKYEMKHK